MSEAGARRAVLAASALAFAVALLTQALHDDPLGGRPIRDIAYYDAWARDIAGGGRAAPHFNDPLYAWLLGALHALLPAEGVHRAALGLNAALLALHVPVVAALGRRAGGGDARVGAAAALLAAVYEPYVVFASIALKTVLAAVLVDIALLAALIALERGGARRAALAGAALGLAALTRPNALLLAPAAALGVLWTARRAGARWPAALGSAAALGAGVLLAVSPATVHNARAGAAVLISMNSGAALYLGNNPDAQATYVSPPGFQGDPLHEEEEWLREAERGAGRRMTSVEAQAWWRARALEFIAADPPAFVGRTALRALVVWNAVEAHDDNRNVYFHRLRVPALLRGPLPLIGFALVAPLGLLGAALAWRQRRGRVAAGALVVALIVHTASISPFVVTARYRIVLAGPLLALAGVTLARVLRAAGRGGARSTDGSARRLAPVAVLVAGAVVVHLPLLDVDVELARDHLDVAVLRNQEARPAEALTWATEALALDPTLAEAHLEAGISLARLARLEEAEARYLEAAGGRDDVAGLALFNLGLLRERRGDRDGARAAFEAAAPRLDGWRPEAAAEARRRAGL